MGKRSMMNLTKVVTEQRRLAILRTLAELAFNLNEDVLLQALDEGRVLADRDGGWPALQAQRETVGRAARRQLHRSEREAAASIRELLGSA